MAGSGFLSDIRVLDVGSFVAGPAYTSSPGMGDHATAMSLFGAIMAALYRRTVTGRGGYVSTSLVANGAWSHGMVLQAAFGGTDWVAVRERGEATVSPLNSLYRTLAELRAELDTAGITYGFAALATELVDDAQLHANGVVVATGENGAEYRYTIGSPVTIDGETKRSPTLAPRIGQHTYEVLRELGHANETIEGMFARGVVNA